MKLLRKKEVNMCYKPEEKAEISIIGWLLEHGINPYVNRRGNVQKNTNSLVFSVKGLAKKPDMVFFADNQWFVMEIKSGIGSKGTRESRKIVEYYKNVLDDKTHYFVNGNKIEPTGFLVGTQFSKNGKLFEKENIFKLVDKNKTTLHGRPQIEYNQTFSFVRQLWDEWKDIKNEKFCMGVLLSEV